MPKRCARSRPRSYVLPDEPLLLAPTVAELQTAVHGRLVSGDPELVGREAMGVLVAGMTADHVLERLRDGMAVITPGDRSDVVLAAASAHAAEGFPSLCCLILNGGFDLHPSISALVSGLRLRLPIISTTLGTYDTASVVAAARGRVTANSQRKIDTAIRAGEQPHGCRGSDCAAGYSDPHGDDTADVHPPAHPAGALRIASTSFFPKVSDDRILKAAGRVLKRCVADLTILGDEAQIRLRSAELGVDLQRRDDHRPAQRRIVQPVRGAVRRIA